MDLKGEDRAHPIARTQFLVMCSIPFAVSFIGYPKGPNGIRQEVYSFDNTSDNPIARI